MEILRIKGGTPLEGEAVIHGSKNSVLPILAATLIHKGESIIHNCPDLRDVRFAIKILEYLGCRVQRENDTVCVNASGMTRSDIPDSLMREMRSSVIFLGAILARCKSAKMSFPGGCELGPRPIDLHLSALRKLGVRVLEKGGIIQCAAGECRGCEINLAFPSVGATENIMLTASSCKGITRIHNAAREPEIEDLQNFLCAMGIRVYGAGSSTVVVEGGGVTRDSEHRAIPDRIVSVTCLAAAAITGGDVTVRKVSPGHISTVTSMLESCGCTLDISDDSIRLQSKKPLCSPGIIRTMPYPGFPTDAQAPIMALAAKCSGTSVFIENIFDSRYRHVSELIRMGANIRVEGKVALVTGVKELNGADVTAGDLRGGAALVIAALSARGESRVSQIWHIDRGYENIERIFSPLGAEIFRENV